MTTEQEEIAAVLLNEAMKPLEYDLDAYAKISERIFDMIINNFEFKPKTETK